MQTRFLNRRRAAALAAGLVLSAMSDAEGVVQFDTTVTPGQIGHLAEIVEPMTGVFYRIDTFAFLGIADDPSGDPVSGAPMPVIEANFHGHTRFEFSIHAPAGQQFRINLPAGTQGHFGFVLDYNAGGVTLVPSSAVGLAVDGVPLTVDPSSSGIDPTGDSLLIEGFQDPSAAFTSSFTFTTLTISLDYPVDSGGEPLAIDDVMNTLTAWDHSHVRFSTLTPNLSDVPSITTEPIPEPASLALLGLGSLLLTARRRRM